MGIKLSINHSDLPKKYQNYKLIPTSDGNVATVYLLDNIYVLKIFEIESYDFSIYNEKLILSTLKELSVPKVVDQFTIKGHQAVVYTQILGECIKNATNEHLKEIGSFLKIFHTKSKNIPIIPSNRYKKDQLKEMLEVKRDKTLQNLFDNINIELKNEGIIHGDLFLDNCKFKENKLNGVFDFADSTKGDFHFDLAVIVVGWCFEDDILNEEKVKTLLNSYGSNIDMFTFKNYIRYALLYYATMRFNDKRNYQILLKQFDRL